MIPPSALLELLEAVELELPLRPAIWLSTKDEMIDCADSALLAGVVLDVAPEELALPVSALIRL